MPGWRSGQVERWTYNVLIFVADLLEDIFWKASPRDVSEPSDIVHLDDEELLERFMKAPPLRDSTRWLGGFSTYFLNDKVVAKFTSDRRIDDPDLSREAMAMRLVWKHTTIPIPRVHRVIPLKEGGSVITVMDFIEGERLDRAWPRLSLWSRARVAWTLRSYVRQLRRIPIPPPSFPGPLGSEPSMCDGQSFSLLDPGYQDRAWRSTQQLLDRLKNTAEERFRTHHPQQSPKTYPELENPGPLVFTHNDLNMRNIILTRDGKVWLIDWDFSGYYPKYFEYLSMLFATEDSDADQSFNPFVPFVTDPYFPFQAWLYGRPPYDVLK